MLIAYPYNEVMPKNAAHDGYVFRNVASLANVGCYIRLICGQGSFAVPELYRHYDTEVDVQITARTLPIIRRPFGLPLCLNRVFFSLSQRHIARICPDLVLLSVFNQAEYHVQRRVPSARYVFEVHQLGWYPTADNDRTRRRAAWEREILQAMDMVTVTTPELRDILLSKPYALTVPIQVVPLAVDSSMGLQSVARVDTPLRLVYVGQLYRSQGLELLLDALGHLEGIELDVVGGTESEIRALKNRAAKNKCLNRVHFLGFIPSAQIPPAIASADALVAPFLACERMPYVAHTKLLEYASWGRPIVAPNLDVVRHCFSGDNGLYLFEAGNVAQLQQAINRLKDDTVCGTALQPSSSVWSWSERARSYGETLSLLACS